MSFHVCDCVRRTLRICAGLLSSQLDLRVTPDGILLHIVASNGKTREVKWLAPEVNHEISEATVNAIRAALTCSPVTSAVGGLNRHLMSVVDLNLSEDDTMPLSFPCIAVQAKFDPFAIVYAPQMITLVGIYSPSTERGVDEEKESIPMSAVARQYCAHEVWDLCSASDHTPASRLPGFEEDETCCPNMILPLAHSPLLFALYVERGRVFHSAINATADCLAMTQMSLQWPKVYFDALLLPRKDPRKLKWMDLGLKSLASFSYAIDAVVVSPSKEGVAAVLNADGVVIPRDLEKSGLSCSFALCSLVAARHVPINSAHWNKVLLTQFSRLAETIAGHKNVRWPNGRDPGELEEAYRLHLGALQGALRKRLYVEWTKSTFAEKVDAVSENPELIRSLLSEVVTSYLARLQEYQLPVWMQLVEAMQDSILLNDVGMERLRSMCMECCDMTSVLTTLCEARPEPYTAFTLPVIYDAGPGVAMREVTSNDVDCLVLYVDALVATKASPKVEYKPVMNPSYPTFTSSQNKLLNVEMARIDWDMKLPVSNVSFIGNVNSGKSSIGGKLLEDLHIVDPIQVDKLGAQAEQLGYSSGLKHAWLMDTRASERAGGFTIDPKWNAFQTPSRRFTIIDNPGHKDYVTNTTTGVFHADVVVLVVSAVISEINLAELSRSQAEEHLLCAFCFGVKNIVVAINKMDVVGFEQVAYEEVRQRTMKKVKKAGFKGDSICYVPVSAVSGDGLLSCSSAMPWYDGPCLLQALDEINLPKRQAEKTFRMVIDQTFHIRGKGTLVCGKVERGRVSVGDTVSVFPGGLTQMCVQSIEEHHHSIQTAFPGDDVGLSVKSMAKATKGAPNHQYKRGMILGLSSNPPVPCITRFEAQIFVTKPVNFRVGYSPSIICHLSSIPVRVTKIVSIIDCNNVVIDSNPTTVNPSQICICEMEALKAFAAETIHDCPRLSRFLIRECRLIVAMGYIKSMLS